MGTRILKISKHTPSLFQGKFEFDAARGVSLSSEHPFERYAFRVLGAIILPLVLAYMYFITASVLNVIARKEALATVTKVQSAIGVLEQQHFALSQGVTPGTGASFGLTQVENTHYVYRPGNVGAATIVSNAI